MDACYYLRLSTNSCQQSHQGRRGKPLPWLPGEGRGRALEGERRCDREDELAAREAQFQEFAFQREEEMAERASQRGAAVAREVSEKVAREKAEMEKREAEVARREPKLAEKERKWGASHRQRLQGAFNNISLGTLSLFVGYDNTLNQPGKCHLENK